MIEKQTRLNKNIAKKLQLLSHYKLAALMRLISRKIKKNAVKLKKNTFS